MRDLSKSTRKGNADVIFAAYCLLLKQASTAEKIAFIFRIFNKDSTEGLSVREFVDLILALQRSLDAVDQYPDTSFTLDVHRIADEAFGDCRGERLSREGFNVWAERISASVYLKSILIQGSDGGASHAKKTFYKAAAASQGDQFTPLGEIDCNAGRDRSEGDPPTPLASPGQAPYAPRPSHSDIYRVKNGDASRTPGFQDVCVEGSEGSASASSGCGGRAAALNESADSPSGPIQGYSPIDMPSPMMRAPDSAVPYDGAQSPGQYGDSEDDEDEIDAASAIAQVKECAAEIEQGDTSGLDWFLSTMHILCGDYSEALRPHLRFVLPVVCNVAACGNPKLASQGIAVLHSALLRFDPKTFEDCSEAVTSDLLAEILLVRSVDDDDAVSLYAARALDIFAKTCPHGFGDTVGALLGVGCAHPNMHVTQKCATSVVDAIEARLQCVGGQPPLTPNLDGVLTLLLRALVMWAHGGVPDLQEAAKLVILKLGIYFDSNPEWDEAVKETGSPVLGAWNDGREPEEDDFLPPEQRGIPSPIAKSESSMPRVDITSLTVYRASSGRCSPACTMYPSVFLMLGFIGRGGRAVGISPRNEFDTVGTWKKREIYTESKVTEYRRVMPDGSVQIWTQEEKNVKDVTHVQSGEGTFAHREVVNVEKSEKHDGECIVQTRQSRDFLHLKNDENEFSGYIDGNDSQANQSDAVPMEADAVATPLDKICREYTVVEPETPREAQPTITKG